MNRKVLIGIGAAAFVAAGVVVYAWTSLTGGPSRADADDPQLVATGKRLYAGTCAECHGERLQGQPDWRRTNDDGTLPAPPHDASGHTWHHPDRLLFDITKRGGQAVAPADFTSAMPSFDGVLSDGEIWAVLSYIKSRWPRQIRQRQENLNRRGG